MTSTTSTTSKTPTTWATIVSKAAATQANRKHYIKISPLFEREKRVQDEGALTYDRIVVSPTHFNSKKFSGYISLEDSEVIRNAIGIKTENLHGTTFYRSPTGELSITYRLRKEIDEQKIKKELNSHFWTSGLKKAAKMES